MGSVGGGFLFYIFMTWLDMGKTKEIKFHPDRHYLGTICKYGHEYEDTGKGLRYKRNFDCVVCNQRRNKARSKNYIDKPVFVNKNRVEARKDASRNCPKYRQCLDEASINKREMKCYKCPDYKKLYKKDCYQEEIVLQITRDVDTYTVNFNDLTRG